jgi:hypothetical protein
MNTLRPVAEKHSLAVCQHCFDLSENGKSNFFRCFRTDIKPGWTEYHFSLFIAQVKTAFFSFCQHALQSLSGTKGANIGSLFLKQKVQHIAVIIVVVRHRHENSLLIDRDLRHDFHCRSR